MKMKLKRHKRFWQILNPPVPMSLKRTRAQAGMAFTGARSDHPIKETVNGKERVKDAALLRTHGTLDSLRGGIDRRLMGKLERKTVIRLKPEYRGILK